jgi:hypothetical protein
MRVPFRTDEVGPDREETRKTANTSERTPDAESRSDPNPDPGSDSARKPGPNLDSDQATGPGLGVRLTEGAKGGLVATLTMTAFRLPVARSLPPTARFWAKFVSGGDPDDNPVAAIALHLLYGIGGGVGFGLLAPMAAQNPADDHRETARNEAVGLLTGTLYGVALSVFGERVVLERLLDMDPAADERLVFHAGHLVYGLSLGTWFGSRTSDEGRSA